MESIERRAPIRRKARAGFEDRKRGEFPSKGPRTDLPRNAEASEVGLARPKLASRGWHNRARSNSKLEILGRDLLVGRAVVALVTVTRP